MPESSDIGATTKLVIAALWSNFSAHRLVTRPKNARNAEPISPNQTIAHGCAARSSTPGHSAIASASAPPTITARVIEAKASAVSLGNQGRTDLELGQRVFHGKFGYGKIVAQEGNKLEIEFEHAGLKKVLDSFVSAG